MYDIGSFHRKINKQHYFCNFVILRLCQFDNLLFIYFLHFSSEVTDSGATVYWAKVAGSVHQGTRGESGPAREHKFASVLQIYDYWLNIFNFS